MATSISASALPNQIEQLLEQRQRYAEAISKIDETLARVIAALRGSPARVVEPKAQTASVTAKLPVRKGKKRTRDSFTISAADLILTFLKTAKVATTKEITEHLVSAGRSLSSVSNALSVLTKAKKLKRAPLGQGKLGSSYSLA